jgi:alpha-tubulin suppressor-like RCC1 family protein
LTLNGSDFPDITVAPRETLSHLNFVNDSLDLETTRKLLRDSSSLLISPSAYELTDATGTAFAFNFTDINAKTALVIIDYASYANPASYLVATNSDPDSRGIAVGKVFRDILQIPFEAGVTLWEGTERNGLLSLRDNPDTTVDETKMGYWLVVHIRDNGIQEISTWFDLLKEDYDFEAIELRAGDALHLVYIEDKDKDGIYSREEFMRGASDEEGDLDSDNDGINDYTELQNGTNLGNKDTDGDGLIDFYDTNPLSFDYFSVDSSWSHAVLIKTDGSLWAWGSNQFGQLALPADTSWSGTPVEIGGTGWKMAAAGYDHSGAIKENGELWMWGANHDGQLGLGLSDVDAVYSPTQMGSDADWRFISFGGNMSHAYKDSGDHWAWGANVNDILGITTESGLNLPDTVTVPMRSNDVDRWQSIEAGENFGIGVKTNGELWSWGRNISGQLCQGYDSDWELIPGQVGDQSNWAAVSSGSGFTLLIDTSGTLWACGSNSHGQLGNPDISAVNAPLAISTGWKQVSAGYYHAVGIKDDGSLWNWGGEHGSNGLQTRVGTDNDWIAVSAQLRASYAIKEDGTVWLMGDDGTLFPPSCMTSVIPEGSCQ